MISWSPAALEGCLQLHSCHPLPSASKAASTEMLTNLYTIDFTKSSINSKSWTQSHETTYHHLIWRAIWRAYHLLPYPSFCEEEMSPQGSSQIHTFLWLPGLDSAYPSPESKSKLPNLIILLSSHENCKWVPRLNNSINKKNYVLLTCSRDT